MSRRSLEILKQSRINNLYEDLDIDGHDSNAYQESGPHGWTWECDTEGNYISCSPEVEKILNLPIRVFLGKPMTRFMVKTESQSALEEAFKNGSYPVEVDIQHILLNGSLIRARMCILKPRQDTTSGNGLSYRGFTTIVQDDHQPILSGLFEEFPNSQNFRFLTAIGMELRTSVNSLLGYSRVMLKDVDIPLSDLVKQDLRLIYEAGRQILLLADELIDYSKIESGALELNFEENVNLADIIALIANSTKAYFQDKSIDLVTDLAPDLSPLRADPIKMRKILSQLLSFAAHFARPGTITMGAQNQSGVGTRLGDAILVSISGRFLIPEDMRCLLIPSACSGDLSSENLSVGDFGLYTTKKLIELHGGQIGVQSDDDKFSKIAFTLPVYKLRPGYPQRSRFALPTNQASRIV